MSLTASDGTFLRFTDEGGALEVGVGRLVGVDQAGNQTDLFDRAPKMRRFH